MIKKFQLDLSNPDKFASVKREITKICRTLTSYGIKNVAVIPEPGSIALDKFVKLLVVINGSEYNLPYAIRGSDRIILTATGTISKNTLARFLRQEYSLNRSLVKKIIAFFEGNAKIPFADYSIIIL